MVIYLPTTLMNMINQATNYIPTDDKYELVYTINMYAATSFSFSFTHFVCGRTCMMVLASIYLYVNGSLPTTSSIKPVEVWLIFNLLYPCLIILSNVLLQVILKKFLQK